ncbi:NHS-like protein 3 isoform 2-T2 [Rhinophrynus dorsalis]
MSAQTALPPELDSVPPVSDPSTTEAKKKKHKGGTLRRALSWLRGRRKKKPEAKKQEDKGHLKCDDDTQARPAPGDEATDNGFFPSGRTPLLEEIHSQAQEGLKSLQRREKQQSKPSPKEENKSPQPSPDTTDNDFRTRSFSCTTENTEDALSKRSEMIQRKGSTFRPHDSPRFSTGKPGRRRKEKRATVVGVPHHIAAELGLQYAGSSKHRTIHELFPNERQSGEKGAPSAVVNGNKIDEEFVVIPTVDGNSTSPPLNGAHISLVALEQTEATLQRHIDRVYQDDSCIGWKSSYKMSPLLLRPKSLAVPGMTTHSPQSDPVNPVMSISPQATYMSKIIPNAVLPPLVDVVALSHSSVRTLSRCSLTTASPASVRGSLNRGRGQSFSSDAWSRSESTETIVSDSSTISSHGGKNMRDAGDRHESGLSTGRASPAPSTGTQDGSDAASLCSTRSSNRSVSLRKSKKAPPPPKRTYSLQQQREMGLPPRPPKPSGARDPWVPRTDRVTLDSDVFLPPVPGTKVSSPSQSDRTLSPSSGYSSQSGTPTLPTRALLQYPESPGSRKKTPPKPERSSMMKSTFLNSLSSAETTSPLLVSPPRAGSSMGDQERQDIIPPHPKVSAPLCPPPSKSKSLVATPSVTPTPSPPPSHHPTPPPIRKSETDTEIPSSTLDVAVQKDSLWPPPPPEAPDVQDLSMADFPPPEEELFLPPPPALVSESIRSSNQIPVLPDNQKVLNGITTQDEKPLIIPNATETPLVSVPCFNTDPPPASVPHSTESPPASVPHATEPPLAYVPHATEPPLASVSHATEPPPASVPHATEPPPSSVPHATEPPPASVPLATEPPPASVPPSTKPPPASVLPSTKPPPASVPPSTKPPPASVPPSTKPPPASVPPDAEHPPASVPPTTKNAPAVVHPSIEPLPTDLPPSTEPSPAPVPLSTEMPFAMIPPSRETPPAPVPPSTGPPPLFVPPTMEPLPTLFEQSTYKAHVVTTTPTLTTVPVIPLEPTLPQHITVDCSVTTLQTTDSTSLSTVSPSASVANSEVSVSTLPLVPRSPLPMPSVWKPVSAPGAGSRKGTVPNQSVAATPKEDANLPIVTPSLLQMVRLRSVQVRGPQVHSTLSTSGLPAPQKPVRRSLSLKSPPGPETPPGESTGGSSQNPQKSPDPGHSPATHKSSATAASFVFARGPRKFVFDPTISQESEATLKRDLVTELKSHVGPRSPEEKPTIQRKPSKIPPPVARKPSIGMPRTPASPKTPIGGSNGSVCTPCDAGFAPPATGTNVAVTMAGHEQQHQGPAEQA